VFVLKIYENLFFPKALATLAHTSKGNTQHGGEEGEGACVGASMQSGAGESVEQFAFSICNNKQQ